MTHLLRRKFGAAAVSKVCKIATFNFINRRHRCERRSSKLMQSYSRIGLLVLISHVLHLILRMWGFLGFFVKKCRFSWKRRGNTALGPPSPSCSASAVCGPGRCLCVYCVRGAMVLATVFTAQHSSAACRWVDDRKCWTVTCKWMSVTVTRKVSLYLLSVQADDCSFFSCQHCHC